MTETVHPVFEAHREAMKAAISHRFDHAEVVVCERAGLPAGYRWHQAEDDERVRDHACLNALYQRRRS